MFKIDNLVLMDFENHSFTYNFQKELIILLVLIIPVRQSFINSLILCLAQV